MNNTRPVFDMTQCKPGDRLVSKHGKEFIYTKHLITAAPFPHILKAADNGAHATRTDEGWTYIQHPLEEDHDIIGFANKQSPMNIKITPPSPDKKYPYWGKDGNGALFLITSLNHALYIGKEYSWEQSKFILESGFTPLKTGTTITFTI